MNSFTLFLQLNKSLKFAHFFFKENVHVYGDEPVKSDGPIPNLVAIFICDDAASRNENKCTISISERANAIALLNKSIAIIKLPL